MLFKNCKELADYFATLVHIALSHSFTLNADGSTACPSAVTFDPLSSRRAAAAFRRSLQSNVERLTRTHREQSLEGLLQDSSEFDTAVYPLIQMGFCSIKQDEVVTREVLSGLDADDSLYLASGYFNLPRAYSEAILGAEGTCKILAAAPQASWFTLFLGPTSSHC